MDRSARATLLIVEDDPGLARLQQRRLERADYRVFTAIGVEDAIQRIRQDAVDLLILDQKLPGNVSGLELYRQVKERSLDVPAILVTGLREDELLLQALRAGVRDFVFKTPEYLDYLLPAVERVLKQVSTERQLVESHARAQEALRRQQELEAEIAERQRKEMALHEAEEALRLSRRRLDLVVEATDLGLWYCDLPLDEIMCNDNCKRHLGIPRDVTMNVERFFACLHPDDRQRTREAVTRAVERGDPYDIEYRVLRPEDGVRWLRAIGRTFFDGSGKPQHFDGVTMDISEHKRTEELLKEADRRKDEFLAVLGHELRNPLSPIRNAIRILQHTTPSDEQGRRMLEIIDRQARQLSSLVDDLLDVERITRGQLQLRKQTLKIAEVVAQAVETSRPLMEARHHHFELQIPDQPIFVNADATRLTQVILNLLNNAAKYTEEGGRISLIVERQGSEAVVRVRDTGMGVPPEMLPIIFEPFTQFEHTLDRAQGGLGIGLTLVRRLVELHGGSVQAFSEGRGKGSEFTVRLPITDAPTSSEGEDKHRDRPRPATVCRHILIVDDNKDSAESMALLLRLLGYDVQVAFDGEAGLRMAEHFSPDIVILDIGLPRVSGLEVARRLRNDLGLRDAFLIAITGYGQDEDRRRSLEAGFDAHLVKPVDFGELQALLEHCPPASTARS